MLIHVVLLGLLLRVTDCAVASQVLGIVNEGLLFIVRFFKHIIVTVLL